MGNFLFFFILSLPIIFTLAAFDDDLCSRQLNHFDGALSSRQKWAVELFDTWAKIQSGALIGNLNNPGIFTKCVNFRHETEVANLETIQGQHCMVTFVAIENATFSRVDGFDWREM